MPAVSVIIPNYNHAAYLHQRIESVLHQTFRDFELILLDDCSTDNSREIIEQYRQHEKVSHVIFNDTNTGSPFKQWQKGLALAAGEYVWIAESDDWCSLDFVTRLTDEIKTRPNVGICFCGSNWVDDKGISGIDLSLYDANFFREGSEEIRLHLVKYCTIQNASAVIMKKQLAQKYISRIIKYTACGDWHLYIDVLQESNLLFVGEKLNNFRWYHDNISTAANKSGTWIREGLKVIAFSGAYKIKYSKAELAVIYACWFFKTKQFKAFKKFRLQALTVFYLWLFRCKNMLYALK